MFPDFKDLIALLNRHKAKYLIVGGYAVARHAQPRATKDLDILILPAPRNAAAVYAALVEFGAPLRVGAGADGEPPSPTRHITADDFAQKGTWYTMGVPPVAIDILPEIPGVTFSAAWKNRSTEVIDESTGLNRGPEHDRFFLSAVPLITNRRGARLAIASSACSSRR